MSLKTAVNEYLSAIRLEIESFRAQFLVGKIVYPPGYMEDNLPFERKRSR